MKQAKKSYINITDLGTSPPMQSLPSTRKPKGTAIVRERNAERATKRTGTSTLVQAARPVPTTPSNKSTTQSICSPKHWKSIGEDCTAMRNAIEPTPRSAGQASTNHSQQSQHYSKSWGKKEGPEDKPTRRCSCFQTSCCPRRCSSTLTNGKLLSQRHILTTSSTKHWAHFFTHTSFTITNDLILHGCAVILRIIIWVQRVQVINTNKYAKSMACSSPRWSLARRINSSLIAWSANLRKRSATMRRRQNQLLWTVSNTPKSPLISSMPRSDNSLMNDNQEGSSHCSKWAGTLCRTCWGTVLWKDCWESLGRAWTGVSRRSKTLWFANWCR